MALAHMAMAAAESGMQILAYALMSNHFHFILKGTCGQLFFQTFIRRFALYLARHGNPGVLNRLVAESTPITSREQFRTEVAYVIRNPFVVREDIHPFVNLQTSAFLYFNPLLPYLHSRPVKGMSIRQKQTVTMSKDIGLIWTCPGDPNSPASCLRWDEVMGNTYWQKVTEGGKTIDSKVWSGFKGAKKYYVRIRAYKKSGGAVHVSKWSTKKSVKAK